MSTLTFTTVSRLRPMEGLQSCGDAVVTVSEGDWNLFAVIDALGHGPDAEKSAQAATAAAHNAKGRPLDQVFEAVHRSLSGLRGVVMSALLVEGDEATFAGVGNVEIFTPDGVARPVAMAGTLGGAQGYRYRSFALPVRDGQRWVLASDGIKARDAAQLLPAVRNEGPGEVADKLLAKVARAHDDVSILVLDVEEN